MFQKNEEIVPSIGLCYNDIFTRKTNCSKLSNRTSSLLRVTPNLPLANEFTRSFKFTFETKLKSIINIAAMDNDKKQSTTHTIHGRTNVLVYVGKIDFSQNFVCHSSNEMKQNNEKKRRRMNRRFRASTSTHC